MSYLDIQDAYWYGNERAFAGYDYRSDPFTYNPNNNSVPKYQAEIQAQLAKLSTVVEQYLPTWQISRSCWMTAPLWALSPPA